MYFNNDNQVPSFIPNDYHRPASCAHNQPCHHCNPQSFSSRSHSQPCHTRAPSRNQYDSPRQCHAHTSYISNCHACNTPSQHLTGPIASFQHCQCYRCQRARREPVLHPAVGLPLGIVTGGLSCAAMGIYRGVTMQRRARKARKAEAQAQAQPSEMGQVVDASPPFEKSRSGMDYVVPSPVSAMSSTSKYLDVSELEDSSTLSGKSFAVSEIEGSPVEPAPPRYTEIEGTQVVRRGSYKM